MSTVSNQEFEAYNKLREEETDRFALGTLPNNPNVTYGDVISRQEQTLGAIIASDELRLAFDTLYPGQYAEVEKKYAEIASQRINPYNVAPYDYNVVQSHPEYAQRLALYNSEYGKYAREFNPVFNPLDQRELDLRSKPITPYGKEAAENMARYGINPMDPISFEGSEEFLDATGYLPRGATKKDLRFLADKFGLKGDFKYVVPTDPSAGIAYKAEGEDEYKIMNSPFITAQDFENFSRQEGPSIAGDIIATIAGTKGIDKVYKGSKFLPQLVIDKVNPGIMRRIGQTFNMSWLSATGATGGDFIRLLEGYGLGYHDRSLTDMMKESGLIGSISFLGTFAITSFIKGIPALYYRATGKNVPPDFMREMDDLLETAAREEAGLPTGTSGREGGFLYGDPASSKEIKEAIDYLANLTKEDIGQWRPTLASATGDISANTLEAIFLKHASDPKLIKFYQQIKGENQEVINRFLQVLNRKFAPELPYSEVTSASLSQGLRSAAQTNIDNIDDQAAEALKRMSDNWNIVSKDSSAAGVLIRDMDNTEISGGLLTRGQPRLLEIKKEYLKPFSDAWNSALSNPQYKDLVTGAGFTRGPTRAWAKGRKTEVNGLLKFSDTDDAVSELFKGNSKNVLNRLRGIGPDGKLIPADQVRFTLQELNATRVTLNELASDSNNPVLKKLVRDLERGLEKQMLRLIDEGASISSGIPLSQTKRLARWKKENEYGLDLPTAWRNQADAITGSNDQLFLNILADSPEQIIPTILSTNTKGATINTPVSSLVKMLKSTGSDELFTTQQAMAGYIKRNILDQPGKTTLEIAKDYRKFMRDHEGTLKALFNVDLNKNVWSTFRYSPKAFEKNILTPFREMEATKALIASRFGLSDVANPSSQDLVFGILAASRTAKQSGFLLDNIQVLKDMVKDQPELQEQIKTLTIRWMTQNIQDAIPGRPGVTMVNPEKLKNLITDGFGVEDVVGPKLTFENYIIPLLGKEGKEYFSLFKQFSNLVEKEAGGPVYGGSVLKSLEEAAGSSTEYVKKAVLGPLSTVGRKVTAFEKRLGEKTMAFMGDIYRSPRVFKETLKFLEGRKKKDAFIRFLISSNLNSAQDLGNEMRLYDEETKSFDEKPTKRGVRDLTQSVVSLVPDRILEIGAFQ